MTKPKYSIISWDCSYRNFFHLIEGLEAQDFPHNQFELIFVEQRSRRYADAYNHRWGLKSLSDRLKEEHSFLFRIKYLNQPLSIPYHVGICNNAGIALAKGDYLAVMDGDQLLPADFLHKISRELAEQPNAVLNCYRHMAAYPVGVPTWQQWPEAVINFNKCLNACPTKGISFSPEVDNFGPLILARRELWGKTGGYDEAKIWSTGISRVGADIAIRLGIAADSRPRRLINTYTVHPWHPVGINTIKSEVAPQLLLSSQAELIDWSQNHREYLLKPRGKVVRELYHRYLPKLKPLFVHDLNHDLSAVYPQKSIHYLRLECYVSQCRNYFYSCLEWLLKNIRRYLPSFR